MRRFRFRLQRALQFASLRENQKKAQIANALQRIRFLDKYLVQLDSKVLACLEASRREVNTLSAQAHHQAIVPALDEIKRAKALLIEEREALAQRQAELIRLAQRRRSLESLKEKRVQEFKQDTSRREQKAIDNAASLVRGWQGEKGR
ncbi:hypothetical protein K2X33_14420 [bacterium]|nr:hypothetical protein [bacterium]